MKKLFALMLVLCLLFAGCTPAAEPVTTTGPATVPTTVPATEEATEPAESSITPLLYQVTDEAGHSIWLFGSIHVGRKDFYPLPDYVTEAFEKAEGLAVEFDIRAYEKDLSAQVQSLRHLLYTDGTTIKDHIDPTLYEEAAALLEDAPLPVSMLENYKPIMWFSLIESLALETDTLKSKHGIDMHMIDAAYEVNKPVISIESADFQYNLLGNFSPELQILLLEGTVEAAKSGELLTETETLIDLWATGNEAEFSAYLNKEEEVPEEEVPLYLEYNQALVVDRNLSMTDFAENALKEGKPMMICVGAAHIVGEGAMAQLLQERGYTVTKLSPN